MNFYIVLFVIIVVGPLFVLEYDLVLLLYVLYAFGVSYMINDIVY
jgi:hypothetical protein